MTEPVQLSSDDCFGPGRRVGGEALTGGRTLQQLGIKVEMNSRNMSGCLNWQALRNADFDLELTCFTVKLY